MGFVFGILGLWSLPARFMGRDIGFLWQESKQPAAALFQWCEVSKNRCISGFWCLRVDDRRLISLRCLRVLGGGADGRRRPH